jgi:hypothetical protein
MAGGVRGVFGVKASVYCQMQMPTIPSSTMGRSFGGR